MGRWWDKENIKGDVIDKEERKKTKKYKSWNFKES